MSCDYDYAMKCIEMIKKINKKIVVVVGGIHPTVALDDFKNNKNIDYIVIGEGEISFTELLKNIEKNKKTKKVIVGKRADLDRLPFEDLELFDYKKSIEYPFRENDLPFFKKPFVTILVGRGCMFNCSFCQPAERILFGKKVRMKSVDNVIKELKILKKKYRFNSLMIQDDCFTEHKEWVMEFCERYKKEGFTQPFYCQSRADIICRNQDMVKKLADAGCKAISIGFESGNQRILNFLRKGTTVEQNYKSREICRKYGIAVIGNFMVGIPTETKKEVMDTINMVRNLNVESPGICVFTPYPGSDLYKYIQENKLSLIERSEQYLRTNFEPKIKGVDYDFLNRVISSFRIYNKPLRFYKKILRTPFVKKTLEMGTFQQIIQKPMVKKIIRSYKKTLNNMKI